MSTFTIEGKQFVYNGKPIRILSGAIHYFHVEQEVNHIESCEDSSSY